MYIKPIIIFPISKYYLLALKVAILIVAIFFSPAVKADTLKNFELSYKELGKSWALEDALPVDENGLGTSNGMKYIPKIVSHAEKALDYAYKIDMRELKNETSDEFVEKFQSLYIRGLILYIDETNSFRADFTSSFSIASSNCSISYALLS